jgi:Ca2+-binding RTX toxin-like protein
VLYGNANIASSLLAGSGADILVVTGAAGTTLTGGAGHDTFSFPDAMGNDETTNFDPAKDMLPYDASLFVNFSAVMATARQVGTNTAFTIISGLQRTGHLCQLGLHSAARRL